MTPPSNNGGSRRRHGGSHREPATLDLKAKDLTPSPTAEPAVSGEAASAESVSGATAGGATNDVAVPAAGSHGGTGESADAAAAIGIEENSAGEVPPAPSASAGGTSGGAAGATAAPASEAAARPRGLGFGSLLGAGLLGGVIGAAGTLATQPWWGRPASDLSTRLTRIEERASAAAPRDTLGALERRLAGLETGQTRLAEELRGARTLAEQSAARAEEALNRPPAPAAQPSEDRLAELQAEVQRLRDAPASTPAPDGRLAALEAEVQRLKDAPPAAPEARVADLQAAVASLQQSFQAAQQTQQVRLAALETEQRTQREAAQAAAERRAAEQQQRLAGLVEQVGDHEQRLAALAQESAARAKAPLAESLRLVVADRVGDALREGRPYAEALAMLRRSGADPKQLAPLEPFASSGAPSAAALAQEFEPLGERIQASARGEATDWTDRLRRMANQVVAVRAVGEPDGSSVSGLVARIEAALARGALRDAAFSWDALPEPARQLSAEWGRKLKARIAAEEAAGGLAAASLSALESAAR